MNKIGIGILFYDELENAKQIYSDIIESEFKGIDFYFVDNGSKNFEFREWLSGINYENIKVLTIAENIGFGGGAKFILQSVPNEIRGYMPGNYKVKPVSLIQLAPRLANLTNFEVLKALRSERSTIESLKTFVVGVLASAHFRMNLMDSGGTPTLVSGRLVDKFLKGPDDYSFEAFFLYMARREKLSVTRIPIPYGSRLFGKSHWQSGFKAELSLFLRIIGQKKSWEEIKSERGKLNDK
jgi:hypothetical protein